MGDAKPTPGPWWVNTPPDTYLEIQSPEGHICGDVDKWANARLIAMAPELFEILKDRLSDCDVGEEDPGCAWCLTTNGDHDDDCRGVLLLAKIEGRSK